MSRSVKHIPNFRAERGLNQAIIKELSLQKQEPTWMLELRLKALDVFEKKTMPTWGPDLSELDIHDIHYYVKALEHEQRSWADVPDSIKNTFDALGIIKAEQQVLAGVGAQYESEVVYKSLQKKWSDLGVIFCSMDHAVRDYPDLVKQYFATVIPAHDNKFAALNSAVWSGGSFVYIPENVHVTMPLQAYFRIDQPKMGQFERTLIIARPGSSVTYVEGCSAPVHRSNSLHSAVVELIAQEGAYIRYTTIQNWSKNVYNLVTKRAVAYRNASVDWVDGNFGSKVTMKYPCVVLKEKGAKGQVISISVAGSDQIQDTGAKMIHLAPETSSHIIAKSISKNGGKALYRGLVKVAKNADQVKVRSQCDALLLDKTAISETEPRFDVAHNSIDISHEATVSALNDEQLFYIMSRGLTAQAASALMINGFIQIFVDELPMEYAVEINRLIAHEMEGSVG
ncbi:MAG: Fe-S cluster assembly protein SufB [Proteobacteria bacterium]|nr:Fe-S cluster assembly protein SufB [Pseudomonadota bacterium]NBP15185.1 Fe-S cluster assembly protein SufB [bacterium]